MGKAREDIISARSVTEDEVNSFLNNGRVKLENFISPELAGEMLEIAKITILDNERQEEKTKHHVIWRDYYNRGKDDLVELFATLTRLKVVGQNAQRFMRRKVPVGFHADMLAVKMPSGTQGSAPTAYHQDFGYFPLDRKGLLTFWVALDDLTPEQGTMRFLSGSHREGPLGKYNVETEGRNLLDHYPYLEEEYELSPPLTLKAGDCTVHSSLVIHNAPENTTNRPRWTYLMNYYPRDALWTGAPHHIFNEEAGLKLLQPIISPNFPIIYDGL